MKRRIVALVAITAAVSLIAGGCATSSSSTTSNSNNPSSSTTAVTTSGDTTTLDTSGTSASPKYGGTLKIIGGLAPGTAGGWPSDFSSMSDDAKPALETLIRIAQDGTVIPWLAESYTVAEDLKSITFKLRQGVKFHDGSVFNAEVAKWNLDNYIAANSGGGAPVGAPPAGAPPSGGAPPAGAPPSGGAPPAGAPPSAGAPPAGGLHLWCSSCRRDSPRRWGSVRRYSCLHFSRYSRRLHHKGKSEHVVEPDLVDAV